MNSSDFYIPSDGQWPADLSYTSEYLLGRNWVLRCPGLRLVVRAKNYGVAEQRLQQQMATIRALYLDQAKGIIHDCTPPRPDPVSVHRKRTDGQKRRRAVSCPDGPPPRARQTSAVSPLP